MLVVAAWGLAGLLLAVALLQLGAPPELTAARQRAPAGPFAESVLVAPPSRALQD